LEGIAGNIEEGLTRQKQREGILKEEVTLPKNSHSGFKKGKKKRQSRVKERKLVGSRNCPFCPKLARNVGGGNPV